MIRFRLTQPLCGQLIALALAAGLGVAGTRPARAQCLQSNGCTVTLTADRLAYVPGQFINLTATTNQDILPPYRIEIFDAIGTFLVGQCDNGRSCLVPVSQPTPDFRTFTAYVAQPSNFLFPPDIQAKSNDVKLSWLFPIKFYAFRLPTTDSNPVEFIRDSGGTPIFDPYHIEIFNKDTGARVFDCPGPLPGSSSGITGCLGNTNNPSGAMYWAVISLPSTDLNTLTDIRDASYYKCVDPSSSPPICGNTALAPP